MAVIININASAGAPSEKNDLLSPCHSTLYYHPLASFCWKPLIALYENATPFTPLLVDLGNEKSRTDFYKIWPIGEFPVLHDDRKQRMIPGSSTIIEYLSQNYPGQVTLIPSHPDEALEAREWNAFYDSYVHQPMQKIVDVMRAEGFKRYDWGSGSTRNSRDSL